MVIQISYYRETAIIRLLQYKGPSGAPNSKRPEGGQVAKKRGISDTKLALINRLQREKFRAIPAGERALFLPHCLRKPKGCRGETTEEGLICKHCSPDCHINQLTSYATSKGYRCFVVPGGQMVFNLVEKHRPKAILGVACHHEMAQAADRIGSRESSVKFAYQGIPLTKSGCVDTKVDIAAVKAVLDMEPDPTPVRVERPPVAIRPRGIPWKVGGFAAASIALVLAALVLMPPMLGPANAPSKGGAPELSFSRPSAVNTVDADGNPVVELTVQVQNIGFASARGITVRATAFYCGGPYKPPDGGGWQERYINRSIPGGGHEDVTLRVRVHTYNDTSIQVEKIAAGKTEVVAFIECKKPAFIRAAYISGYSPGIQRQANVSVEVFNPREARQSGSLTVKATSYTPIFPTGYSQQKELPTTLAHNGTWYVTLALYVADEPSITVQLLDGSGPSVIDDAQVGG